MPVARLSHLSEADRRAYVLADNKLALNAGWDQDLLAFELQELIDVGFDVELTGFSLAEVDFALDGASESDPNAKQDDADVIPAMSRTGTSRAGDLWQIDRHLLLCGDAREPAHYARLMGVSWRISFSLIRLTTYRSTATSADWAGFGIVSSPWARARCPRCSSSGS